MDTVTLASARNQGGLSRAPVIWVVGRDPTSRRAEPIERWPRSGLAALAAILVVSGMVFAADLVVGPSSALPVLYTVSVALCLRLPGRRAGLAVAALATGLTVAAYAGSSGADPGLVGLFNRLLSLAAVWGAAEASRRVKRLIEEVARAKTEAERATLGKTRFLSAAGHDLRHPIQAGILFHDLLKRRLRGTPHEELVFGLGQSFDLMQAMVNTLLEISRLDAGRIEPRRVRVVVSDLFDRLATQFGPEAEAAGLRLTVVSSGAVLCGDPELLQRVLQNLLSNAIKFTERGRVLLGCRRAGRFVRIQVWDSGIGIPADRARDIFEEFQQLRSQSHEAGKGFGLGLSLVERLGRALDYSVGVRSVVGRGSAFEVVVPLADRS